jgi:DNA-binding response OmpR family regulator
MRKKILCVSYDVMLLRTRCELVERHGHDAIPASTFNEATRLCRKGEFDLVLMGHSIPPRDKGALIEDIKEHCPVPVLALMKTNEPPFHDATESVDAMHPEVVSQQ